MPGYVKDALYKFLHPNPTRPQHFLHQWIAPNYGTTDPKLAHPTDDSPALNSDESNNIQQVVGIFLYYTRAVRSTMLVTINSISAGQEKITQAKVKKVVQLLNYEATYPEAITCYQASGIIIHMHINIYFLFDPGSNSIAGKYPYLSAPWKPLHSTYPSIWNAPIHMKFTTMKNVLESSIEAELVALFVNCR